MEWVWADGWYDGPISGLVVIEGERVYARMAAEHDDGRRTYDLYSLSKVQVALLEERHRIWEALVGTRNPLRPQEPLTDDYDQGLTIYERLYPRDHHYDFLDTAVKIGTTVW